MRKTNRKVLILALGNMGLRDFKSDDEMIEAKDLQRKLIANDEEPVKPRKKKIAAPAVTDGAAKDE